MNRQLYYHIQVLYIIANTLFRNKKFTDSLHYLELMHQQMHLNRNKYYKVFEPKYCLLKALNCNYTNRQTEAISIIKSRNTKNNDDLETALLLSLSLVMFNMQATNYKSALRELATMHHTDSYYESKVGLAWVIKKNLIEIILHIELGNIDLVDSRLLSFKRSYYPYLKSINQQRVLTYLGFVERYYKYSDSVVSATFRAEVEDAFEWVPSEKEDIFVMSFYAWLKSKMENKPLYPITLDLVKQAID